MTDAEIWTQVRANERNIAVIEKSIEGLPQLIEQLGRKVDKTTDSLQEIKMTVATHNTRSENVAAPNAQLIKLLLGAIVVLTGVIGALGAVLGAG